MANNYIHSIEPVNFSDFEKLQLLHLFLKGLVANEILPNSKPLIKACLKDMKFDKNDADIIFKYIADLYEFGDFPTVVEDKPYSRLERPEYFRSASSFDHLANTLVDFDRHYGWGSFSNGLYFDYRKEHAARYHMPSKNQEPIVMKVKLGTSNIVNALWLKKAFVEALETNNLPKLIENKMRTLIQFLISISNDEVFDGELFVDMLLLDPSKLAIILNIDALKLKGEWHPSSIIILNRGKIVISKSEFNRICENSNLYKTDLDTSFEEQQKQ